MQFWVYDAWVDQCFPKQQAFFNYSYILSICQDKWLHLSGLHSPDTPKWPFVSETLLLKVRPMMDLEYIVYTMTQSTSSCTNMVKFMYGPLKTPRNEVSEIQLSITLCQFLLNSLTKHADFQQVGNFDIRVHLHKKNIWMVAMDPDTEQMYSKPYKNIYFSSVATPSIQEGKTALSQLQLHMLQRQAQKSTSGNVGQENQTFS